MKRGSGMNDQDERSREMEIRMSEALAKIKSSEPLILAKPTAQRTEPDQTPRKFIYPEQIPHDERVRIPNK